MHPYGPPVMHQASFRLRSARRAHLEWVLFSAFRRMSECSPTSPSLHPPTSNMMRMRSLYMCINMVFTCVEFEWRHWGRRKVPLPPCGIGREGTCRNQRSSVVPTGPPCRHHPSFAAFGKASLSRILFTVQISLIKGGPGFQVRILGRIPDPRRWRLSLGPALPSPGFRGRHERIPSHAPVAHAVLGKDVPHFDWHDQHNGMISTIELGLDGYPPPL